VGMRERAKVLVILEFPGEEVTVISELMKEIIR
jgi:hypothetical protein